MIRTGGGNGTGRLERFQAGRSELQTACFWPDDVRSAVATSPALWSRQLLSPAMYNVSPPAC